MTAGRPHRLNDATLDALVAAAGDDAHRITALAQAALGAGLADRALALAEQARALAPGDAEIRARTADAIAKQVPQWHFTIVRDSERNAAYDRALRRAVTPQSRVLDIGAGSGLLAMMAARAGAARVASCEMQPQVAAAASEIVAANGLGDRVAVIAAHSRDVDAERDLGGRADVIVAEIVSNNLLGQSALETMANAVPRLLAPGGAVIPSHGTIRVALAHWTGLDKQLMVDGFDLTAMADLRAAPLSSEVRNPALTLAGDPADLFAFDFSSGGPWQGERRSIALTAAGGPANGIVQWIHLRMDAEEDYENRPGTMPKGSAWTPFFYPFDETRELAAGETVAITGLHDRRDLWIWAD